MIYSGICASPMGSTHALESAQGKLPLFSFGVISDVQYADIPDGKSFLGIPRYYRHSFTYFVINFGDIVDGFCPKDQSLNAVRKVVTEFEKFKGPVYHLIGNHCLYNLPREKLLRFRIVVLDGYDISAIGWPPDNPNTLQALLFLRKRTLIQIRTMEWLDNVLQEAMKLNQKVIVCCHLPLDPGVSCREALLWNYDEVLNVIHQYDCVKACLSGHDHKGGHSIDSHGVHHRSFEAALECPPGTDAFGYIDVYDDRLILVGADRMKSTSMLFHP
ncbi:hypothetical protein K2173_011853 [Erythroxylum novogranatense]|uniref:Calcineurin-like phosphoesterase domain-containing protein n=1 Tax=Erythroxylum novogranatense TaxID=1862640 RepID=A0AAV8S769_9ROSI|nr:hypothetical protein K2173_011853 [Erythroxylum novogranatense]